MSGRNPDPPQPIKPRAVEKFIVSLATLGKRLASQKQARDER
jgi:hypothetical protein